MAVDARQPPQHVSLTWESDANQFILFDATLNETHTGRSQLTAFPIEKGADHTDHIRRLPDELSLIGATVTDSPLVKEDQEVVPANTGGDVRQRATSAYNFLMQTKDQGRLVSVFTTLRTYRNMAIESIDVSRDKGTSRIVQANIQLREILVAITERVDAPVPADPVKKRKVKRGKQNTEEASEANKAKARDTSLAIKGLEALGLRF